jgi:hypothetical protein
VGKCIKSVFKGNKKDKMDNKNKGKDMSKMNQLEINELHKLMFKFQPWEIINMVFDYFAAALETAPQEKIEDFYKNFRDGVDAQIKNRKDLKTYG